LMQKAGYCTLWTSLGFFPIGLPKTHQDMYQGVQIYLGARFSSSPYWKK